jgi:phosphate transport system substrate-binding protein
MKIGRLTDERGIAVVLLALLMFCSGTGAAQTLSLKGSGSTFAAPLYFKWFDEYRKVAPGVQFTYAATGSGRGIHDVMLGIVDFGATDGPLTKTQMLDFSSHRNCEVLHFPIALGADVPAYNIPEIRQELNFTPQALADIFLGKITRWNDREIAAVNPGVPLPAANIVVVHRSDGSGTTYVWTDYLSKVSSAWLDQVGVGIWVNWPVGLSAKGNEGVAKLVSGTPDSIGYLELNYAIRNKIAYGKVRNRDGRFVKADLASVTAAAAGLGPKIRSDFRVSITDAPGAQAYPISSFTWMLVPSVISEPAKKSAMVDFLHWALTDGQRSLEPLTYAVVPSAVVAREEEAIQEIK